MAAPAGNSCPDLTTTSTASTSAPIDPKASTSRRPALLIAPDNAGDDWELINDGIQRRYTLHISAAPHDANLVLVTVSENARRSNPQFYRSTDAGQSWRLVDGLGEGENPQDMVVAFEWDPEESNKVYAGTDGGALYASEDRGVSWKQLPVQLGTVAVGAMAIAAT